MNRGFAHTYQTPQPKSCVGPVTHVAHSGRFVRATLADCVRAVDFVAAQPEVDAARIAVTGASQGGGLSLSTAALDKRISFCAPDIPFMCDYVKYFKASKWPEMDRWIAAAPHRSWDSMLQTISYFDTLNMADKITCPVFMSAGLQDGVCPPATVFSTYNRLAGPKEYVIYPDVGHSVNAVHNERRQAWLLEKLGAAPTPDS